MGAGRFDVSEVFIRDSLHFPVGWEIVDINLKSSPLNGPPVFEFTVIGSEFPSIKKEGTKSSKCVIKITKEALHFEVEEIDGES